MSITQKIGGQDVHATSEPVLVTWQGGLGGGIVVSVDPYSGRIIVNGREFDVSKLLSDDIDTRIYRELSLGCDQEADAE